ncbi:MAG: M64 family metallopeptidase, partial [Ignavibacteria bacterium]|nr:M64 family metallopeptidase [Ignavibacteria bacterium]
SIDNKFTDYVLVHEFGHGFAGLGDEYYTSEVAYEEFYKPGVEPWEPNLTTLTDFGKKWKNKLDKNIPIPTPPDSMYKGKLGVFEGGGYVAKGVYRPMLDCAMKSRTVDNFCIVCKEAIIRMIDYYCK